MAIFILNYATKKKHAGGVGPVLLAGRIAICCRCCTGNIGRIASVGVIWPKPNGWVCFVLDRFRWHCCLSINKFGYFLYCWPLAGRRAFIACSKKRVKLFKGGHPFF